MYWHIIALQPKKAEKKESAVLSVLSLLPLKVVNQINQLPSIYSVFLFFACFQSLKSVSVEGYFIIYNQSIACFLRTFCVHYVLLISLLFQLLIFA